MESSPGEVDGNTEELTGRKKSKFKFLKTRLFGRLKKKDTEGQMKQSQSTNDVTAQGSRMSENNLEDDCQYPQGTLSSRALSHDSIFLADQSQSSEPTRILSQENIHSKIKALQLKLQQQKMRLGPPPLLIPGKRVEDSGTTSEDDGLPCSPPEMSFQEVSTHEAVYKNPEANKHLSSLSLAGTGSEEEEQGCSSQPPSRPLSPVSRQSSQEVISSPTHLTSSSTGVDFSSPAHYVSCLDNSAARHRMSIKPRNQRASTKRKKQATDMYRPRSSSMNSLDQPLSEGEEAPEIVISTETIYHQSCLSQVTNLEEKHLSLLVQQEAMALDVGPLCREDDESGELSHPKDRIATSPVSFQQETTALKSLNYMSEQVGKEPVNQCTKRIAADATEGLICTSLASQSTFPEVPEAVTDSAVTEKRTGESVDQVETLKSSVVEYVSLEPLTRPHPVPAPRTKKPSLDSKNSALLKISHAKPTEGDKEADLPVSDRRNSVPFEVLDESSREDDKLQRPSSFRFSIASAKYRSKTISGEHATNQEEESFSNMPLLKNTSYSQCLEPQVEKVEKEKNNEVSKNTLSTSERRTSLQRVVPQNVFKTAVINEGCSHSTDKKSEKPEESKESLFGVKLRATCLSLKYRSDVAKLEQTTKRHSLDAHQMLVVSEGHPEKEPFSRGTEVSKERKSNLLTKKPPKNSEPQDYPVDAGSDREANTASGPAWMSLAREKTRPHQPVFLKCPTQSGQTPHNSTSLSSPLTSCTQQPQKPIPQPRPHLQSTEKSQLRACHSTELPDHQLSQQTPPKPAPRVLLERKALITQSTGSQLSNGAELVDIKGPANPGVKSNSQTEPDALRRITAFTSSLPHQHSPSDRGQPSWMELAKRKSLAWSDKSLD